MCGGLAWNRFPGNARTLNIGKRCPSMPWISLPAPVRIRHYRTPAYPLLRLEGTTPSLATLFAIQHDGSKNPDGGNGCTCQETSRRGIGLSISPVVGGKSVNNKFAYLIYSTTALLFDCEG